MQTPRTTPSRTDSFAASRLTATLVLALGATSAASAATLSVGPGKTYAKPCAAFAAAKDGDTIEITAATYSGDVCTVSRNNLTIRGVNGRPKIDAAGKNASNKGIWVVTGNNITIDNVEMYGAKVMDANGAAIRLEGANFTMRNSFLHDNENGILANANMNSDVLIEYSEFGHNGYGDGQSHNLYIGHVKSLTFRYNYTHDANIGHNLKSRANVNGIFYNRFSSLNPGEAGSTAAGQPSYEINLPNAGTSYIVGNIIQQPAANQNPTLVAYGEEGTTNTAQDLYVVNNTFLNDYSSGGTFLFVSGKVTTPALIQNNIFSGIGTITSQASAIQKTNYRSVAPGFVNRAAYDLHPTASALVINAGSDPGKSAAGVSLAPTGQYKATAYGEARAVSGQLDVGAYEAVGTTESADVTWTACANEGGTCTFSGTREVRYGNSTIYTSKIVTGSAPCTNAVFGDPLKGGIKTCSYASTTMAAPAPAPVTSSPSDAVTWTTCAGEGATCSFSGTREVRYGANGSFATKVFTGSVACTNGVFGDPAHNALKSCSFSSKTIDTASPSSPPPASNDPNWVTCATEGATCSFTGQRQVRYGANTSFTTKTFTGPVACSNAAFGGDPAYRQVKSCSYSIVNK